MNDKLDDTFVIMGIDPGTNIMGFGIIKVEKKEMRLIDMIEYKLPKSDDHNIKLSKIFKKNGEFSGTCASQSPFLNKSDEPCGICGKIPSGSECANDIQ